MSRPPHLVAIDSKSKDEVFLTNTSTNTPASAASPTPSAYTVIKCNPQIKHLLESTGIDISWKIFQREMTEDNGRLYGFYFTSSLPVSISIESFQNKSTIGFHLKKDQQLYTLVTLENFSDYECGFQGAGNIDDYHLYAHFFLSKKVRPLFGSQTSFRMNPTGTDWIDIPITQVTSVGMPIASSDSKALILASENNCLDVDSIQKGNKNFAVQGTEMRSEIQKGIALQPLNNLELPTHDKSTKAHLIINTYRDLRLSPIASILNPSEEQVQKANSTWWHYDATMQAERQALRRKLYLKRIEEERKHNNEIKKAREKIVEEDRKRKIPEFSQKKTQLLQSQTRAISQAEWELKEALHLSQALAESKKLADTYSHKPNFLNDEQLAKKLQVEIDNELAQRLQNTSNISKVIPHKTRAGLFQAKNLKSKNGHTVQYAVAQQKINDFLAKTGQAGTNSYRLGDAYDNNDCFADAFDQGLREKGISIPEKYRIQSTTSVTASENHRRIRAICEQYAKECQKKNNPWIKEALLKDYNEHNVQIELAKEKNDKSSAEHQQNLAKKESSVQYHDYLMNIGSTADEMQDKYSRRLSHTSSAIWQRPDIDGKILCEVLSLQLLMIELVTYDNSVLLQFQLTTNNKSQSLTEADAIKILSDNNNKTISLVIFSESKHYVPLLKNSTANPAPIRVPTAIKRPEIDTGREEKSLKESEAKDRSYKEQVEAEAKRRATEKEKALQKSGGSQNSQLQNLQTIPSAFQARASTAQPTTPRLPYDDSELLSSIMPNIDLERARFHQSLVDAAKRAGVPIFKPEPRRTSSQAQTMQENPMKTPISTQPSLMSQTDNKSQTDVQSQLDVKSQPDVRSQLDVNSQPDVRSQFDVRSQLDIKNVQEPNSTQISTSLSPVTKINSEDPAISENNLETCLMKHFELPTPMPASPGRTLIFSPGRLNSNVTTKIIDLNEQSPAAKQNQNNDTTATTIHTTTIQTTAIQNLEYSIDGKQIRNILNDIENHLKLTETEDNKTKLKNMLKVSKTILSSIENYTETLLGLQKFIRFSEEIATIRNYFWQILDDFRIEISKHSPYTSEFLSTCDYTTVNTSITKSNTVDSNVEESASDSSSECSETYESLEADLKISEVIKAIHATSIKPRLSSTATTSVPNNKTSSNTLIRPSSASLQTSKTSTSSKTTLSPKTTSKTQPSASRPNTATSLRTTKVNIARTTNPTRTTTLATKTNKHQSSTRVSTNTKVSAASSRTTSTRIVTNTKTTVTKPLASKNPAKPILKASTIKSAAVKATATTSAVTATSVAATTPATAATSAAKVKISKK